jgi:GntR family colanic acid and biofilm gene transcriptional regulator
MPYARNDWRDTSAGVTPRVETTERSTDGGSLVQLAFEEIEKRILSGQLLPNAKISLRSVAYSIGMSMQPVREAVNRLVAASALEITRNRTIRMPALDRAVADEIWSIRMLLEGEAVRRFANRVQPGEVQPLYAFNKALRRYRFGVDVEPTMANAMAWNVGLARGSGSPMLIDMISRLRLRYAPVMAYAFSVDAPYDEDFVKYTIQIQDELLLAIEAGDAAAALHLRCADIRSAQRYLYRRIGWDPLCKSSASGNSEGLCR